MRKAGFGTGRGVYVAPWHGEEGELVLIAITSRGTLAAPPLEIPHGASRLDAADGLSSLLDQKDPDRRAIMKVI